MRKWLKVGLLMLAAGTLLAGCGGNRYMQGGSDEYHQVKADLLGEWKISSYTIRGKEMIGSSYNAARVVFEGIEEGRSQGNVQFTFTVKDNVVKERAKQWAQQKISHFEVDSYDVVVNAHWLLHPRGDVLYIRDALALPVIGGNGKDIGGVVGWESRLFATSALGEDGQETDPTSIYPELPAKGRLQLAPSQLKIEGSQKINFSMTR
jgi:hypothetical protein